MEQNYASLQLDIIRNQISTHCAFSLGRERVLSCVPEYDSLLLKRNLAQSKEALACTIKYSAMPFMGIKNINQALDAALKDQVCTIPQLLAVADHVRGCLQIEHYMTKVEEEVPHIHELVDSLTQASWLANEIETCFSNYGEILDSASTQLSTIRQALNMCDAEITRQVNKFMAENGNKLMENITTTRNNRVVVLAKVSDKNTLGGFVYGNSASGQAAYVEPHFLVILNNQKQTLKSEEEDEIVRILFGLSQKVKQVAHGLGSNLETLSILDEMFAKASWAKKMNGCVAEITDSQTLILKQARHPLIDPKTVVANTYRLCAPHRMLLITGPNTGGKTVSIKIIGLFVLMTYCAMPISCDEASIPLFDHVYADIGDDQSIEQSLSTFSAHLQKLAMITSEATSHSLILLDEIGSGTDPKEGESLAIAILEDLRQKKAMTITTTHYGKLKAYGKKHEEILLASVQFDLEKMQPTYRYIEGLTGQSNAFEIAQKFGLKQSIIDQAVEIRRLERTDEEQLIETLEKQLTQVNQTQERLDAKEIEMNGLIQEVARAKHDLQYYRDQQFEKAQKEAEGWLQDLRQEADKIIASMHADAQNKKPHELLALKKQLDLINNEEEEIEVSEPKNLKIGDYVEIKQSHQVGQIQSIHRQRIVLLINHMTVHTTLSAVRPSLYKPSKQKKESGYTVSRPTNFSSECNIIGCRVEEAMSIVAKYLDEAILFNAGIVRIVHGAGTGALRSAVHELLKKTKQVDDFRLGAQGEGGVGATVVTLISKGKANA